MPTETIWPERPAVWPDVMTAVQVCQYLQMDDGRTIQAAESMLRYLRRTRRLPCVGRVAGKLLFRRAAVDAWLAHAEERTMDPCAPDGSDAIHDLPIERDRRASNSLAPKRRIG